MQTLRSRNRCNNQRRKWIIYKFTPIFSLAILKKWKTTTGIQNNQILKPHSDTPTPLSLLSLFNTGVGGATVMHFLTPQYTLGLYIRVESCLMIMLQNQKQSKLEPWPPPPSQRTHWHSDREDFSESKNWCMPRFFFHICQSTTNVMSLGF